MYELLPEFWVQKEEETNAKAASRAKAKRRIQDINVWAAVFRPLRKCAGNPVPTVRPRAHGLYGQYPLGKPGV